MGMKFSRLRSVFGFLACICVTLLLFSGFAFADTYPAETTANGTTVVTVGIPGTYDTSHDDAAIALINQYREEANTYQWTDSKGVQHTGLAEPVLDFSTFGITGWTEPITNRAQVTQNAGLTYASQIRSVEASFYSSHVRPSCDMLTNTFMPYISQYGWGGEALAPGYASAVGGVDAWASEKTLYLQYMAAGTTSSDSSIYYNIGHYWQLINQGNTTAGLGSFKADGKSGYTIISDVGNGSATAPTRSTGSCVQRINVLVTYLSAAISGDSLVPAGSSITLTSEVSGNMNSGFTNLTDVSNTSWSSSDTSVATVDSSGNVTGVAAGTATINFSIGDTVKASKEITVKASVANATVGAIPSQTYSGTAKTPEPTVTVDGIALVKGTDYTLAYENNINAGTTATMTITGTGSYTGTKQVSFAIDKATTSISMTSAPAVEYTGSPIPFGGTATVSSSGGDTISNPTVSLTYATSLTGSSTSQAPTDAGAYYVQAYYSGDDNHSSSQSLYISYVIDKASTTTKLSTGYSAAYTGSPVPYGGTVTVRFAHGVVSNPTVKYMYSNSADGLFSSTAPSTIGTHYVVAIYEESANFKGSESGAVAYEITKPATTTTLSSGFSATYTGSPIAFGGTATVTSGSSTLSNPEVTYTYSSAEMGTFSSTAPTDAGTWWAKGTFDGDASHSGSTSAAVSFVINPASISSATVGDVSDKGFTGSEIKPTPSVSMGGTVLSSNTDYTLSYSNNMSVGSATITVSGRGNYTGTTTKVFKIVAADIAGASLSSIPDQTYTKSEIKPELTVTFDGEPLTKDVDFTLSYANNVEVGTATATITGRGNYAGTKSQSFNIVPAPKPAFTYQCTAGYAGVSYQGSSHSVSSDASQTGDISWSWAAAPGSSLPAGLTMNSSTGTIEGTPTAAGTYSLVITATGAYDNSTSNNVSLQILDAKPAFTDTDVNITAVAGESMSNSRYYTGYPAIAISVSSGALPSGVTISMADDTHCTLSGTPAQAGTYTATLKAHNAYGDAYETLTFTVSQPANVPVYRLLYPPTCEHLYTTDANEVRVQTSRGGWRYEGVAFFAPASGTPVTRMFNPGWGTHHYSSDAYEIHVITTQQGWRKDFGGEPTFYSGGQVRLHRLFNRSLGQHMYTTDAYEVSVITTQGWVEEPSTITCVATGDLEYPFPG